MKLVKAGEYNPIYEAVYDMEPYKYRLLYGFTYYSERYDKHVTCEAGMLSDGATFAKDLKGSMGWWVHDKLCERCSWDDGTPVSNWQASRVLGDILKAEEYGVRTRTWTWATFLLGGWKIKFKGNGWF